MRKLAIALIALLVVAGVVYVGSQRLLAPPLAEPTPASLYTGPAAAGQVRCSGRVIPKRWLGLSFATSGRVARIAVQEGSAVKRGDLLAELESEDSGLDLRAAEQRLAAAQARLAQAQARPAPEEIRAAEARVGSAQARLDALRASPTALELEEATLRLQQARNRLWGAQAARDAIGGSGASAAAYEQARAQVAQAEIEVRLCEIAYERVKAGPTHAEIAAAEASLAQEQASLASLRAGPSAEELAILQASVAEARIALDQISEAQAQASEARRLYAPFDGTVTSIAVQEGQPVNPSLEAMVLADLSEMLIEGTDFSELDVARVRPDFPVEVALPGTGISYLQGRLSYISPQATVSPTGEVTYRVLITLDRQEPALRWGMSALIIFGRALGQDIMRY
ncbi:MAG: efflux RND transporter periplasmic adaptor subunit [Anaerolineae bacterium]|nr:efflux RND transporter periplasmic adaptor subunit [Anaerolineae bacterium]